MSVTGIGGLFLRSRDPDARAAWYREHLSVGSDDADDAGDGMWRQEAGPTVFAPFPADSDYFAADQPVMLNLRVDDLAALTARLEAAGIPVERRAEWDSDETGAFARIHDPEGLPIELWQPPN